VEKVARAGLVAQGLSFGLIAILVMSRAVVFGLVSWFFFKAAADYAA
jgi:hypothetical protein